MTRLYRITQFVRGLAALGALMALLAGVPYALVRFVGWPLPRSVPSWHQFTNALGQHGISDTALIDVLAIVLWIAWAVLTLAVLVEALTMAQSRQRTRVVIAGHLQPFAGALLGAIVFSLAASFARAGGASASFPRAAIVVPIRPSNAANGNVPDAYLTAAVTSEAPSSNGSTNGSTLTSGTSPAPSRAATHVVRDGDTLWSIAADRLGDAARWTVIFEMNRGLPQSDGGALDNPHWIYPGWVLRLPEQASPPLPPTPAHSVPSHPAPATSTIPTPTTVPATPIGPVAAPSSGTATRAEPAATTNRRPVGAHSAAPGHSGAPTATTHEQPIELASGARLGGALVAAILGALVSLRLRRRQRYRPRAPRPGRQLGPPALTPTLRDLLTQRGANRDMDEDLSAVPRRERAPLTGIPSEEAFAAPDRIEIGTTPTSDASDSKDDTVELALGSWSGLTLTGPGAESTLRAMLAALLARSGPYDVQFVTTTHCASRLLPGLDLAKSITQRIDVEAVCESVEREIVSRARQFEEDDVVDAAAFRKRFPAEPFPLVVALVDEVPTECAGRWSTLAIETSRFGGTVIELASDRELDPSTAPKLVIAGDGRIEEVTPLALASALGAAHLFQLSAEEAADLLAPVAAIHNYAGPEEEPPIEDRAPEDRGPEVRANGWQPTDDRAEASEVSPIASEVTLAPVVDLPLLSDDLAAIARARQQEEAMEREAWPELRPLTVRTRLESFTTSSTSSDLGFKPEAEDELKESAEPPSVPAVSIQLLGPPRVEAFGMLVTKGLRGSAFELLAWFALRPEGATLEAAADALWPDASTQRGHQRFWTALGNLRTRVGKPEGSEEDALDLIAKVGDRYVPDASVLDVDLWRFEAALTEGARPSEPERVVDALRSALVAYRGDFLEGSEALWTEPPREDLHRRALDAACRLAALHEEEGRTTEALDALGIATRIAPINEEAHRRVIGLLAELGRFDEALGVGARLKDRLFDIDLDPEPTTDALLAQLRRRQQRVASSPDAQREERGDAP